MSGPVVGGGLGLGGLLIYLVYALLGGNPADLQGQLGTQGGGGKVQSRAIDSTGYVQPTYAELRAVRGRRSVYHNNAIQTWLVRERGEVSNVQLA